MPQPMQPSRQLGWKLPYFCDADHINLATVDRFLAPCDFYTMDVADYIGKPAEQAAIDAFVKQHPELLGRIRMEGAEESIGIDADLLTKTAAKFLFAVQRAGEIYRKIEAAKGKGTFISEVSMDETDRRADSRGIADYSGGHCRRRHSHSDHRSEIQRALQQGRGLRGRREPVFARDGAGHGRDSLSRGRLRFAGEPEAQRALRQRQVLDLSGHSRVDDRISTGVHLKTAGTNWLEELIGLAEAGGDGLALAKEIYARPTPMRANSASRMRR